MDEQEKRQRFARLVMPHANAAYNLARWLIRDKDDAQDVLQDALLRAYKFLESCRDETARQWVVRIVRNCCYDWLNAHAALGEVGFADVSTLDPDGTAYSEDAFTEPAPSPELTLQRKEERDLINSIIADLPPMFREAVVLRDMEGMAYKDIALIAGVPVGTVMSRLSRGRAQIMEQWRQRHGQE